MSKKERVGFSEMIRRMNEILPTVPQYEEGMVIQREEFDRGYELVGASSDTLGRAVLGRVMQ